MRRCPVVPVKFHGYESWQDACEYLLTPSSDSSPVWPLSSPTQTLYVSSLSVPAVLRSLYTLASLVAPWLAFKTVWVVGSVRGATNEPGAPFPGVHEHEAVAHRPRDVSSWSASASPLYLLAFHRSRTSCCVEEALAIVHHPRHSAPREGCILASWNAYVSSAVQVSLTVTPTVKYAAAWQVAGARVTHVLVFLAIGVVGAPMELAIPSVSRNGPRILCSVAFIFLFVQASAVLDLGVA